jgi:hypothetical protein
VPVTARFDQLRCNAHTAFGAGDRTFHHRIELQLPADLRQGILGALETHRRSSRHDAQGTDLGEVGDQRIGHSVGEVLLLPVAREIFEG